jgi:hypothetical protein
MASTRADLNRSLDVLEIHIGLRPLPDPQPVLPFSNDQPPGSASASA